MKIFVTGGTGFIGSRVVSKLLVRKHKLLLLVEKSNRKVLPRGISVVKGDLKNIHAWSTAVKKFKPDAVVHLAWEGLGSHNYSSEVSKRNLENSLNLIVFAGEIGCKKFLSTGSCWEYGSAKGKLKESAKPLPPAHVPEFVFAKRTIQEAGSRIAKRYGMQFLWPRLFFVYGPGQRSVSLIPFLVSSFRGGNPAEIKNKTGGNDFVHVDDVASGLIKILEKCKKTSAVYNVGSGRLTGVLHVANVVAKEFKQKPIAEEPKKIEGFYADISKIKKEIGWTPRVSIKEGIRRTIKAL